MTILSVLGTIISVPLISAILNILRQIFFKDPRTPPEVFHYLPVIGSTIQYGMDPYAFFFKCRAKVHHISSAVEGFLALTTQYGDCFTFTLLGKKTTVFLGAKGNQFILNGSSKDLNAEEVYRPLTAPVFGKGVVYDCPNAKLMDQKRVCLTGRSLLSAC
jgi:sterol 14-demethylase